MICCFLSRFQKCDRPTEWVILSVSSNVLELQQIMFVIFFSFTGRGFVCPGRHTTWATCGTYFVQLHRNWIGRGWLKVNRPLRELEKWHRTIHLGTRCQVLWFYSGFRAKLFSPFGFSAINNGILDTYQLKSLDALLGMFFYGFHYVDTLYYFECKLCFPAEFRSRHIALV